MTSILIAFQYVFCILMLLTALNLLRKSRVNIGLFLLVSAGSGGAATINAISGSALFPLSGMLLLLMIPASYIFFKKNRLVRTEMLWTQGCALGLFLMSLWIWLAS